MLIDEFGCALSTPLQSEAQGEATRIGERCDAGPKKAERVPLANGDYESAARCLARTSSRAAAMMMRGPGVRIHFAPAVSPVRTGPELGVQPPKLAELWEARDRAGDEPGRGEDESEDRHRAARRRRSFSFHLGSADRRRRTVIFGLNLSLLICLPNLPFAKEGAGLALWIGFHGA